MKTIIRVLLFMLVSAEAHANVIGIDAQNFNPTSNGIDFVTVQSSETLEPGIFNLGLFFNYATNTLPNYQDVNTQSLNAPQDELVSMDFSVGLGIMKDWDIGLTIPQVLWQNLDSESTALRGIFESTGLTEIRGNTKYRLFGTPTYGVAFIFTVNYYLIENFPFTGSDPGPTLNFEFAGDHSFGKLNLGANIGYRKRNPGEPIPNVPVQPYPDEFIFSLGASYLFPSIDTKIIAEIYNSIPVKEVEFTSDRDLSSSEILAGIKWDVTSSFAFHIGAATELYHGSASPDFRAYTGINWAFGPLFSKKKKVRKRKRRRRGTRPTLVYIDEVDFNQTPLATETFIAKDVLFDFNSSRLSKNFTRILKDLARYLVKGEGFKSLTIVGHTDSIGRASYNQKLSIQRSKSVRKMLARWVNKAGRKKIRAAGMGESEPIADNGNYQGRALNRRVEFKILR